MPPLGRPRKVLRVPRRFVHSVEAIGVSSAFHPSSQPPPLLDSNPFISNLSISPVPHSSQPENVSSSQSHLSNLLHSFTCSFCKLHKRLAAVKY